MPELYDIYLRKSRADRDAEANGQVDTLLRHRTALLALAQKRGLTIHHIFDEVVSGESIANRPEMQKLLAEVEHGEIAAVLIGEEATLKRVYLYEDHISLEAENPQYRPMVYWGEDMNSVHILGKAVAFTSDVR